MTAPADVWAVETRPNVFVGGVGYPKQWRSERAARSYIHGHEIAVSDGFPRVVRLRLVRADEPEQPAEPPRDDVGELRECVRELLVLTQHLANELVAAKACDASWVFRQLGVLRDRLAAPGQGGAT